MKNWGFKISQARIIDLDKANTKMFEDLCLKVPSAKRCIMCGGCSATCTASNHTNFNFRNCNLMFRRGQFEGLAEELDKCMLCGKCKLVCPRGVNTRAIIYNMRIILNKMNYKNIEL
ncbi:MAG: 4Fe-4S dicluster domain-containing protein [Bacteroidales bacterium]|jgi:heterodisulfide reductase subunit C|nr:4Fe-4S dicluster domain-containing protein [Bacteroidales bacterium]MCK9499217.1 4Fe-4S dicluster domain-containing protein [Bacteroidales bacterium]MDY0315026.1 4Fe-4S dicluster domain-containing protein [Bacteroidales bacterium]NLB85467.1 4Fe-4S dicluster domain-containing protein [Bacteroidales bacterium]